MIVSYLKELLCKYVKLQIPKIEEIAGMDVLCSDKTMTFTPNKLTVDKN